MYTLFFSFRQNQFRCLVVRYHTKRFMWPMSR